MKKAMKGGRRPGAGRVPERFCKRGHDKWATAGSYIRQGHRGRLYYACGVCAREWWRERYRLARRLQPIMVVAPETYCGCDGASPEGPVEDNVV